MFLREYLSLERKGFSGINHVLIAIMLFLLLLIIPVEPFTSFLEGMLSNPIFGIMAFLVICGGALLPDMDNLKSDGGSAATWSLGMIGSIISSLMVTISSVITSIFHGKKDVRPNTQHRFFWHTLFVPIVMFILMRWLLPDSSAIVIDKILAYKAEFPTGDIITLLLIGICVYTGSILLLKKFSKFSIFIRIKPSVIASSLMVLSIGVSLFICTEYQLKLFAYCVALGYLFHLIGDLFADGGIPALFPISGLWGKFFMRVKLIPLTVKTGSTLESLLKVVFLVIDIILFYYVFFVAHGTSSIDLSALLSS